MIAALRPQNAPWIGNLPGCRFAVAILTFAAISPAGAASGQRFAEFGIACCGRREITAGPDGALWFIEDSEPAPGLYRITTDGQVSMVTPKSGFAITAGPDGNLWLTESSVLDNKIGRLTTAGVITEFTVPTADSEPAGIAAGPDGNLWFAEYGVAGNKIGRITTTGVISEFEIPTADSVPYGIAAGSDGNLWFTEVFATKIGRINLPLTCAPSGTSLCLNNDRFKVEASWTRSDGTNGSGQAMTLTSDAGYLVLLVQ